MIHQIQLERELDNMYDKVEILMNAVAKKNEHK